MVLRNAISQQRKEDIRPSVVVVPNHDVLRQWRDEFICNGFPANLLRRFRTGQDNTDFDKGILLFATRYDLQSELKAIFDNIKKLKPPSEMRPFVRVNWYSQHMQNCIRTKSALWPHLGDQMLFKIWVQFLAERSELRKFQLVNPFRSKGELLSDCITRLTAGCLSHIEQGNAAVFETVVIDEVRE